jgi:hypothetical protein
MKLSTVIFVGFALVAGEAAAIAQQATWERNLRAGNEFVSQGQYAQAERLYLSAIREAESFGPKDQRLALALASLALLYMNQGQTEKAVPLAARALEIRAGNEAGGDRSQFPANGEPREKPETANNMAVFVNGVALTPDTLQRLAVSGTQVQPGRYWYDTVSGAWGYEGGPMAGQVLPNQPIGGRLRPDASGGRTGVYVNGRELHPMDIAALQRCTPVYRGRYWVNAQGIGGLEGRPPSFNLAALCQQASGSGNSRTFGSRTWHNGDGSWSYHSDITGLGVISDGKDVYVTGK